MSPKPLVGSSGQPEVEPDSPSAAAQLVINFATTADDDGSEEPWAEPPPAGLLDDGSAFAARLAGAMQSLVGLERTNITKYADERRRLQLELIREREAAGVRRLRAFVADELQAVEQWVESEVQRIREEGERRKQTLQAGLDERLAAHGSTFDRAVEEVEAALASYRADVDAYFARLDGVDDPEVIAKHAVRRPRFPALPDVPEFDALGHARAISRGADAAARDIAVGSPLAADPSDGDGGECEHCAEARQRSMSYCGVCGRELSVDPVGVVGTHEL